MVTIPMKPIVVVILADVISNMDCARGNRTRLTNLTGPETKGGRLLALQDLLLTTPRENELVRFLSQDLRDLECNNGCVNDGSGGDDDDGFGDGDDNGDGDYRGVNVVVMILLMVMMVMIM